MARLLIIEQITSDLMNSVCVFIERNYRFLFRLASTSEIADTPADRNLFCCSFLVHKKARLHTTHKLIKFELLLLANSNFVLALFNPFGQGLNDLGALP